ncbi:MAG: transposase [Candidatus Omnitrophica bacterium]|nr:transposase [Candidatus Omnitrophota bacterium]
MNISAAFKNNRVMKSLTGLTISEFENLSPLFDQSLRKSLLNKPRLRKIGGGRHGVLPKSSDKLFYILFYLKVYPTYDLAGFVFNVDRSRPCNWVAQFIPILEDILQRKCVLPKRKIKTAEEFFELFPDVRDLFVDGTEHKVQRPRSDKNQKRRYSGKKKTHTRKNLVASDENKRIIAISPTKNGKIHDKKLFDKAGWRSWIPPDVSLWVDTGFIGITKNGGDIFMPKKKSKNHPLTKKEKQENRAIASIRVVSEHAIGGLKRFNSVAETYRNRKGQDDKFIILAAGLWNTHLQEI